MRTLRKGSSQYSKFPISAFGRSRPAADAWRGTNGERYVNRILRKMVVA